MFFYYFCGNFVFTLVLTNILYVFVDRPFFSLIKNDFDIQMAYKSLTEENKIENFKNGVILGEKFKDHRKVSSIIMLNQEPEPSPTTPPP